MGKWIKKVHVLFVLILSLTFPHVFSQGKKTAIWQKGEAPEDEGLVYIYRPDSPFEAAVHFQVLADEVPVSEVKMRSDT
ncbi:MAG: hypothetical protein M0P58_11585 [Bacteroidales bacterium]|nr:hypothetical protein [Bacteroidales bacterium]